MKNMMLSCTTGIQATPRTNSQMKRAVRAVMAAALLTAPLMAGAIGNVGIEKTPSTQSSRIGNVGIE